MRAATVAAGRPSTEMDVAALAPGGYLLTVAGPKGQEVRRVLKK